MTTSCAVFWRALRASQNTNKEWKFSAILHNKTSNKRFIIQHAKLLFPCVQFSRIFIYGECMTGVCQTEWNWRGKSNLLIGQQKENKAKWFLRFRPSYHWHNLFHFSQREKIVFRSSKLHINWSIFALRFVPRKKRRKEIRFDQHILLFETSIQFVACVLGENLSNLSSGVQIPRDICTRFRLYLYSAKSSWIMRRFIPVQVFLMLFMLSRKSCDDIIVC